MARTLYFPDGSCEVVIGNTQEEFQKIIRERLGLDAENLFTEILEDYEYMYTNGVDIEELVDVAITTLDDTIDELLSSTRIDKNNIREHLEDVKTILRRIA